ncbi:MAG: hypothetical protein HY367_03130 [Candidatus Aenigmarchaeota archaeon]|nr:hypothetical protein [Candidatus Aenigmarchaeota archaeon]
MLHLTIHDRHGKVKSDLMGILTDYGKNSIAERYHIASGQAGEEAHLYLIEVPKYGFAALRERRDRRSGTGVAFDILLSDADPNDAIFQDMKGKLLKLQKAAEQYISAAASD